MPVVLRFLLILISVLTVWYMIRKIRKAQVQIEDSIFWIFISFVFVFLSLFPGVASFAAQIIGIQSPVNFIFLAIIFILLIKVFLLSIKLSQVEGKLRSLIEEIAVRTKKEEEK